MVIERDAIQIIDDDRYQFTRLGKLEEMEEFFKELKFPHDWEYKKFYKLGVNFTI